VTFENGETFKREIGQYAILNEIEIAAVIVKPRGTEDIIRPKSSGEEYMHHKKLEETF
jgi:hypothetical protein